LNSKHINWNRSFIDNNFHGAHRVQTVDIDNDSDLDILGAGYLGHEIAWWSNKGGDPINWEEQVIGSFILNACIAYAIDLDNDGDQDVIGTGQGTNKIYWWRNDGGAPIKWKEYVIDDNFVRPWPLHAGDLDGDEDIDIVVGSSHRGSNKIHWWKNDFVTGIENTPNITSEFQLLQNYPNPFNPSTTIEYFLPRAAHIEISLYNNLGEKIRTLIDKRVSRGSHNLVIDASELSNGVYYYILRSERDLQTRKLILLK